MFAKSGLIWSSELWEKKLKSEKLTEAHDDNHLGHKTMTLSHIDLWNIYHTSLIFIVTVKQKTQNVNLSQDICIKMNVQMYTETPISD